jgi:hypothetical protein
VRRLGVPRGQRQHQLGAKPLLVRIPVDEGLQFGDHIAVPAARHDLGVDAAALSQGSAQPRDVLLHQLECADRRRLAPPPATSWSTATG